MMHLNRDERSSQSLPPSEEIRVWQRQLVQGVLRALTVVGFLAAAVSSYYEYVQGRPALILLYWLAYTVLLVIALWRRVPYAVQVSVLMGVFYLLALMDFATEGRGASARLFLLLIPFMGALFLGRREAILSLVVIFATMVAFAWAFSTGRITDYREVSSTDLAGWASNTFVLLMLGTLIVVSLNYLVPRLARALGESRSLTGQLKQERSQLEEVVSERTKALARRSTQLETAAQIARDAAMIQDVDRLMAETVRLVSARFGFYHCGIFLLDETKENAVLRAASSAGGQRMLARGHRLKVGEAGIVGYVTRHGKPRIALDVGADAVYFDNPDLPETRSEVTLPLLVRGEIIGALDVQSTEPGAFDAEDVIVLQTLADQIAVAISNAWLFQQAQESLAAERRAYGELSRQAWQELIRARPDLRQRYDPQGILPTDGRWRDEMKQALKTGEPIPSQAGVSAALAVPLKVRDQVIGVLDVYKPAGEREWQPEELALLQTLVDQLGLALDSARLYEDSQRRAARERLISEIAEHIRASLDPDVILQTMIQELGQALGAERVTVEITSPTVTPDGPPTPAQEA